jgi:competence ComEA-like helix-hairpin-helix protein
VLSSDERRALAIILGLLLVASAVRWVERPTQILADAPPVDLVALEESSRLAKPPPRTGPPTQPIDPNAASLHELQRLPGVGPAMAQRIIEAREEGGAFTHLEDMRRVRGIGEGVLGRIEPYVGLPRGAAGAAAGSGSGARASAAVAPHAGAGIDLNVAGMAELVQIRGVGPVLAARLVARRDSLGRFRDWSEVDAVAGVGPAMLLRLQEMAYIGR